MSDITVGVDIGTTSVKAVAVGGDGVVLARTRVPHAVQMPTPGAFEHDPNIAWRSNVLAALASVADGLDVAAVNVSAMVPSLAPAAADGSALGPGLLYGDVRGADRVVDSTQAGDSGELLAFLKWHAQQTPDAAGFWPAQAFANHALCGVGAIDSSTAMTAHPLHNYVEWDSDLAKEAGATVEQLPMIVPGFGSAGTVRDGLVGAGALVGGGTIDAFGEQLCAGGDETGDVLVLCGTTLITWGTIEEEKYVDGLWTIPHSARGKLMIGGPSNAGGLWLEHNRRWLGSVDGGEVAGVSADDLPVWLPYVRGERTPLHRRDLRASLHGAGLAHSPAHLRRAAYEATAFVVRHHIDLARDGGGLVPTRIVATGGGTRDSNWMHALADVTGLPVHVSGNPEGAALGAAYMARCVAGLERNTRDAARWATTVRVLDPSPSDAIESRYRTFRELTAAAIS